MEVLDFVGGYELQLSGLGLSGNMSATVCGVSCNVTNSTYYSLTLETPAHVTTQYVDFLTASNISIDMVGDSDHGHLFIYVYVFGDML